MINEDFLNKVLSYLTTVYNKCYYFCMLFKRKDNFAKKITCPRCGLRTYEGIDECPDCGLVFSRLNVATNKEAKAKKLRGDRDFILKTNKLPNDVSFIKLLLLCIFLGPFGAHAFYVGRYLRGSILLGDFCCFILIAIFNQSLSKIDGGNFLTVITILCGAVMLTWFWDILMIITKRFKVPIAIDVEGEIEKQKSEYLESLKEIEKQDENNTENVDNKHDDNNKQDENKTQEENKENNEEVKKEKQEKLSNEKQTKTRRKKK